MLSLLILIPWVLVVGALSFIILRNKNEEYDYDEEDEEDFFFDDEEHAETVRVAVYEDRAYWVHGNVFYESEVIREPDFTTARPIDTMSLSQKDLTKLMVILDELQENTERE